MVFYYQWIDGSTKLVCVAGGYPHRPSPIWSRCNTSVLMLPGTYDAEWEDDE
jgi:hypothetical protein